MFSHVVHIINKNILKESCCCFQELETRVRQLEAHNKQLQNLLAKNQGVTGISQKDGSDTKKARAFDFTRYEILIEYKNFMSIINASFKDTVLLFTSIPAVE